MKGFTDFLREQGVVGLAVAVILGGAVGKVVTSLVTDIINPVVGLLLGNVALADKVVEMADGAVILTYGNFVAALIDFTIVAAVVYFGVKKMGLDKLDKAA